MAKKWPERLIVQPMDYANFSEVTPLLVEAVKESQVPEWSSTPIAKLIVPLSPLHEHSFLKAMTTQLCHQTGIYSIGRIEVFAFFSCSQAWPLTANYLEQNYMRYRSQSVLFGAMFDVEPLTKVPWNAFIPVLKQRRINSTDVLISSTFL